MFLTHDNHIKWEKIGVGALVTGVLVFLGIEWFDKPLFLFLRQFDCSFWHHLDAFFAPKVWIFLTCIAAMVYCIVNYDSLGIKRGGNLSSFFEKTKRNNAFLIFYSVLGAGVTVKVLKTLIGRARPVFFEALGMTGFYPPSMEWANCTML